MSSEKYVFIGMVVEKLEKIYLQEMFYFILYFNEVYIIVCCFGYLSYYLIILLCIDYVEVLVISILCCFLIGVVIDDDIVGDIKKVVYVE